MFIELLLHASPELSAHSNPFGGCYYTHFESEKSDITIETLPHSLSVSAGGPFRNGALPIPSILPP